MKIVCEFNNHKEAQDMIVTLSSEMNLSYSEAIKSALSSANLANIKKGFIHIAYPMWRHEDFDYTFKKMTSSEVEIDVSDKEFIRIAYVAMKNEVDINKSIDYFVLSELESLGYHT